MSNSLGGEEGVGQKTPPLSPTGVSALKGSVEGRGQGSCVPSLPDWEDPFLLVLV